MKAKDFGEESYENVSEKYMMDFDMEDEELENIDNKRKARNFTHLYEIINEQDLKSGKIEKFNWSGN